MRHTFLFARQEGIHEITAAAVMTLVTTPAAESHDEAMGRFTKAVTRWLNDTEEGRKEPYADDFNIADFLSSPASNSVEFDRIAASFGVKVTEASTLAWDQLQQYDRILNEERE